MTRCKVPHCRTIWPTWDEWAEHYQASHMSRPQPPKDG